MTVKSNSARFGIKAVPQLPGAGWEVRVFDHNDFSTEIAVITEFSELSIGPEINIAGTGSDSVGAGSITFDRDGPFWTGTLPDGRPATVLMDYEFLFAAYEDGVRRFDFLGRNVEETIADDSETHRVVIAGPGAAEVLRWAAIFPRNYPAPAPAPPDPNDSSVDRLNVPSIDIWTFEPNWPAMRMWYTVFAAAQERGTIPWVTPLFTATHDALVGGSAWEYIPTVETTAALGYQPQLGTDLLTFLRTCTGQETSEQFAMRAEWVMWPNFQLEVRKTEGDTGIGRHREDEVIFFIGGTSQKTRTRTREDIANVVIVRDANYQRAEAVDHQMIAKWNRRERLDTSNANVADEPRRFALARAMLEQTKDEKSEWVIQVPYDLPNRRPFVDYNLGDWIGISSIGPDGMSTVDAYRVLSIVVTVADDIPTVELTLQSRLDFMQRSLEMRVTAITKKVEQLPSITSNPTTSNTSTILYRNPDGSLSDTPTAPIKIGDLTLDPAGLTLRGTRVFFTSTQPGAEAQVGDFWVQWNTVPPPEPAPPVTPPPGYLYDAGRGNFRIPGTNVLINDPTGDLDLPNTAEDSWNDFSGN